MQEQEEHLFEEAITHCKQKEFTKAKPLLEQLVAMAPAHLDGRFNLAKVYFRLEEYQLSIDAFDELINLSPSNAHYISERGVAHHLRGDQESAMTDFNRALALEPANPYRYASRAYLKSRLKDLHGALADYNKAIELDPEDAISLNNKGLVEQELGYQERAQASFKRADKLEEARTGVKVSESKPVTPPPAKEPPSQLTSLPQRNPKKPGFIDYLRVIKDTLSTKDGFKEFGDFWRAKLGR